MELKAPLFISARLMPAIKIGDVVISLTIAFKKRDEEGRTIYKCFIDFPDGTKHEIKDLRSGCQGGTILEGFQSLLSFLSSAGESFNHKRMAGENSDLFPQTITEWASNHIDELALMDFEINEQ